VDRIGRRTPFGDVAADDHPVAGLLAGVRERHCLELDPEGRAVARVDHQFGIAGPAGAHRLENARQYRRIGDRSAQQVQAAPDHLVARKAGAAQESVVDEGDRLH
jgi:hypothetical protein